MVIKCPSCGHIVKSTDGFCESCGLKIDNISSSSPVVPTPQPQPPPMPQKEQPVADSVKKVCGNKYCLDYKKVQYSSDANFCRRCASDLVPEGLELEAEAADSQKKKGFLVMPDGSQLEITPTQRLIGRSDLSKYVSESDNVDNISRRHMTVFKEGEKYYVQDGKTMVQEKPSINKTWVISGGQKDEITAKGKQELKDGDQISIADIVRLSFTLK